ncbi:MAG TPA: TonB-dependent receptor [Thermoanaerobaculia bacterium]|nr:TonB-dependent receptor [Thermoanaerobaculia bacterium]
MAAALLAAALLAPAAAAQPVALADTPDELKELTLEQLLEVRVTSLVKRPQRWVDAIGAVSVITGDEIRRSGARSLPEALRLAPGLHVARFDSRTWAISARGLNITTSNKMLVLIDGRSVHTPLFSGVFWDVQAPMLEDVERIEVIRGPGATLWGANAVNGVINVITRGAAETRGGLAVAGLGTEESFGALRWGGEAEEGHYRVYGKLDRHGALVFADGTSATDPLTIGQGGFRWDSAAGGRDAWSVHGDLYRGEIGHPVREDSDVDGGNLFGRWRRELAGGSRLELRGFYDHTFRRVPGQFEEDRNTWDLELQHDLERGRHEVVWGGGFRWSEDDVVNSPVVAFLPDSETAWVANLFVQDEIALAPGWRMVVGTKVEEHSTMDLEVMPTLRLAWQPRENAMLWGGAARAVRAPTRLDRDVVFLSGGVPVLVGSDDFAPEEVIAYEVGARWAVSDTWFADLSVFHNRYEDLRTAEPTPGTVLPFVLANLLTGETSGATASASWQATPALRLHGGLTALDTELVLDPRSRDLSGGAGEANDPDLHGFLRADLDLPRNVEVGLWLRHVGELPEPHVPAYTELDLRLGWRASPALSFAVVGQNLLDEHHAEFGAPPSREEIERGVYGEVRWSF